MAEEGDFDDDFGEDEGFEDVEEEPTTIATIAGEEFLNSFTDNLDDTALMVNQVQSWNPKSGATGRRPVTRPYLTKYEKTRVLGLRARMIEQGAPIYVDAGLERDPLKIAVLELEAGRLPLAIKRPLPGRDLHNSAYELVPLSALTIT